MTHPARLTEAVAAAPAPAGLDAVRAAFTAGLGASATAGAVVFAALAALALVAFARVPTTAVPATALASTDPDGDPAHADRPVPAPAAV